MYEQEVEYKIIRTKHKVRFRNGTTVESLISDLKKVPIDAEVEEIDIDDNLYVMSFHHERNDT